jgi:NAD(P)-dependent dehydrogenase (short-subunit alcohol dehydrogenase family)
MSNFALVTGASRGIGRAIATDLSRHGFSLIATGRDHESLSIVLKGLSGSGHRAVAADLSNMTGIEQLATQVAQVTGRNGLRVFIHCAAQTPDPIVEAKLEDTSIETIQGHTLVTASSGPILLKLLKPTMSVASRAHAILLSSDWTIDGISGPPVFSAAKGFATTVWRQARKEYLTAGIVLTSIIAGNIASYDVDWAIPKWTIDDSIEDIKAELGITRISLMDVTTAVRYIIESPFAAVTEIRMVPLDPDYVP